METIIVKRKLENVEGHNWAIACHKQNIPPKRVFYALKNDWIKTYSYVFLDKECSKPFGLTSLGVPRKWAVDYFDIVPSFEPFTKSTLRKFL